jgi:hypothetical protein
MIEHPPKHNVSSAAEHFSQLWSARNKKAPPAIEMDTLAFPDDSNQRSHAPNRNQPAAVALPQHNL